MTSAAEPCPMCGQAPAPGSALCRCCLAAFGSTIRRGRIAAERGWLVAAVDDDGPLALHHVDLDAPAALAYGEGAPMLAWVATSCATSVVAARPDHRQRHTLDRCPRCAAATAMPPGRGSPEHDWAAWPAMAARGAGRGQR